jgi:hypothetical protein
MAYIKNRKMLDYVIVSYEGKDYGVCHYVKNDGCHKLFIVDEEDLNKILSTGYTWYDVNGYIGYTQMVNKKTYCYYLHNLIMDKENGGGKGQQFTIDHISRNKYDNRKDNLRLISQSSQNENQKPRKRTCVLPEKCGINVVDIPKCVYYCAPQSGHGEMFVAELKKNNARTQFKSSSANKFSLKDKLIEMKQMLYDIAETYPELMKDKSILENYSDEQIKLIKEYNEIIKLSEYEFVNNLLIEVPKKILLNFDINEAGEEMKKYLKSKKNTAIKTGRRHTNNLPDNCRIIPDMIPKYCYYQQKTGKRGDAFVIDRHPKLPDGKRQWRTSGSKKVSTMEKFKQLKKKLTEIESIKYNNSGSKSNITKKSGNKITKKN